MWQNAAVNGTFEKITPLMNDQPMGVLSVSVCNEKEEWRYFIAVASTADIDDSLEEYVVPACTWAIFKATPHKGLKPVFVRYCLNGSGTGISIQELEQRIVTEWLPTSGFEFDNAPDIEVYLNPDPNNMQYEVWVPIRKV